ELFLAMTVDDSDADVLVIGGGPAGAATAIECLRRGLRVRVIEAASFPRAAPGETMPPGAATILEQLGVWAELQPAISVRPRGRIIAWDGPATFHTYGGEPSDPWRGCQVFRSDLDALLLRRAAALGADVRQPCRPRYPMMIGGRVA